MFEYLFIVSALQLFLLTYANDTPCSAKENMQKLSTSNSQFAVRLHQELAGQTSENIFFSPLSISTAFGMLFYGARRGTAEDLRNVMGYKTAGLSDNLVHTTFKCFLTELNKNSDSSSSQYKLKSGNLILVNNKCKIVSEFKNNIENLYNSSIFSVDFQNSGPIVNGINQWVRSMTEGKIDSLVEELDPAAVMVLFSAIYFKGTWKIQFQPEETIPQIFYNNGLQQNAKSIPMMHLTAHFRYASAYGCQVLEMPYKGNKINMVIVLPDRIDGLAEFEKNFTLDKFVDLKKRLFDTEVDISLPKFKLQYSEELSAKLQKLGLKSVFQPGSDFTGISPDKHLYLGQVLHKAIIEVNEEGSEAAAVTGIVATRMRPIFNEVAPQFTVDRPFLFFIVEDRSDMILFMGRVNSL